MSTDTPPPPPPTGGAWLRPVALILACLVLGFVGGWILRGDDGTVTVLETGAPTATETAAGNGDGDGAAPPATTAPPGTTAEEEPPPPRSEISLVVLNGTDIAGFAGDTAAKARSLGYDGVIAGNAPTGTDPTTVYFATPDDEPAAGRVAADLEFDLVRALPAGGPIATAAEGAAPGAEVVVVLGP